MQDALHNYTASYSKLDATLIVIQRESTRVIHTLRLFQTNRFGFYNRHDYPDNNHRRNAGRESNLKVVHSNEVYSGHDSKDSFSHPFSDIIQSIGDHDQLLIVLVGIPGSCDKILI